MSPRSTEQNEKIRTEKIEAILAAAIEVYVEKGFRGTEMGDIAKKAGVARGLVYYYFKSKLELFRELVSRYTKYAESYIQNSLTAEEEAISKLKKYTRFYLEMAYKRPVFIKFYRNIENDMDLIFGEGSDALRKDYTKNTHEPLIEAFRQAIAEGKLKKSEPKIMVHVYWGALNGALDAFMNTTIVIDDVEETIAQIIDLIFSGIQK